MFNKSSHFRLSLFFQNLREVQYNHVVRKLGLSLITITNCCSKFLKMVLFSPFQVGAGANFSIKEIFVGFWELSD